MRIPGLSVSGAVDDLPWRATSAPGVHWLPIRLESKPEAPSDPPENGQRGASTVLIRMEPGAGYGAHRHLGPESVLVLRGGYRDDLGEYTAGSCATYPAGSSHAPIALGDPERPAGEDNPACLLYAVATGGIELVDLP